MKLLSFLLRTASRKTILVAALGLLGGLSSAGLIAVVNAIIQRSSQGKQTLGMIAVVFGLLAVLKIVSNIGSSLLLARVSQEAVLTLCSGLCRRVVAAPFRSLEDIGIHRILTALTEDVSVLSSAFQAIPTLVVNIAMLAGCAVYLAYISWIASLSLVLLLLLGALCYKFLLKRAFAAILRARKGRDTLFRHFRSLTEGMKELKLNRARREAFLAEDIDTAGEYLKRENINAMNRYAMVDGWSQMMFYLLLAALIFGLPVLHKISFEILTAYVFAALYMMGPVWGIIGSLPVFNRGMASLERLEQLGLALAKTAEVELPLSECANIAASDFRGHPPTIEFRDVFFAYGDNGKDAGFTVGPVNLCLNPGELVFIIGGNGSGKSTLVKLLTGLYTPDSGEILVDGKPVSYTGPEAYQELFSAVYSDFYLFDRILGFQGTDVKAKAEQYLQALDLAHKVQIEGSSFSTTALSQGQRRRMALLSAYMEGRPVYVLDEWAADQDPTFREIFYLKLLPELRDSGRTVVVITHDDRYFHLGDRVIRLDYGQVKQISTREEYSDSNLADEGDAAQLLPNS